MEDKILYENQFTPTEENIHEYIAQTLPERSLLTAFICCVIVAAVGVVWWQIMNLGLVVNQMLHIIPAIFLMSAVMFTDLKLKQAVLRYSVKKYMAQNKNVFAESRTRFYENKFEYKDKFYDYLSVSKVLYGSSCMYFTINKNEPVMIKDDDFAFTSGERELFWPFLESKINVKKATKENPLQLFRH